MASLKLILGTMEMGRRSLVADKTCFELLDIFVQKGFTELDTALMYTDGKSEQIIGRYMSDGALGKLTIATKANPWSTGLGRMSVLQQASASLSNLQSESVDIYYLHAPDHNTPIEETLAACQQLYTEGKFKELGLSNYASWEVVDIYHICKSKGWVLPTVYQGMYNPITRMVEAELIPALRQFGIRFYAYNPLAGGLLTGRYSPADAEKQPEGRFWLKGTTWAEAYRQRFWRASVFQGIDLIQESLDLVYGSGKVSLVSATFRWLNHHSIMKAEFNDAVILGASCKDHLVANMKACEEGPLDERVVKAFDAAWQLDKANCAVYFR